MMSNLTEDVKKFIVDKGLIADGEIILAGVSGGADSVCLFHVLRSLREELLFNFAVVHINHMIREAAEGEAKFVEELCKKYDVQFFRRDIDIPGIYHDNNVSEEEAGRNERYKAFCEIAGYLSEKYGRNVKIATAHNRNDQTETVLHNLFRGSRIKGLSGIRAKGSRDGFEIIRPLIETDRDSIENYLDEQGFKHCNDDSNFTDDYTRNRIRHNIIPVAKKQINPQADKHVAETADYFAKIDDFLEAMADETKGWIVSHKDGEVILDCNVLASKHEVVRERLIIKGIQMLYPHVKDIQDVHINTISRMVLSNEGSKEQDLPYGIKVIRVYDKLKFYFKAAENPFTETVFPDMEALDGGEHVSLRIPGMGKVNLRVFPYEQGAKIPTGEYTKWLNYDKINNSLQFRTRSIGDIISIGNGNKKLKKFMIDEKIPVDVRDSIYILADGNNVLWVPGYRIGDLYKLDDFSNRVLEVKVTKE
ncbi:tRNA lysidine(34) synthetase TilS [Butyrivibrio sp. WCE2006]|uniref:tRNA lysidine(34) synthetase TilS n=1 Tax=Butyrivibrio sp. WCE2006 TaxID=1410611 RepID=UPI0005D2B1DA|nr:tRNA lysidine(34) synthetase TilS [Butyrivibrio sp. WCE2006]